MSPSEAPQLTLISVYDSPQTFVAALKALKGADLRNLTVYSPVGISEVEHLLPQKGSPVRFIVLLAGIAGLISGYWLSIGSAWIYGIIVGGKPPTTLLPYTIIGFELTVLLGGLSALGAMLYLARMWPGHPTKEYDPLFNVDRFGISLTVPEDQVPRAREIFQQAGAERVELKGREVVT